MHCEGSQCTKVDFLTWSSFPCKHHWTRLVNLSFSCHGTCNILRIFLNVCHSEWVHACPSIQTIRHNAETHCRERLKDSCKCHDWTHIFFYPCIAHPIQSSSFVSNLNRWCGQIGWDWMRCKDWTISCGDVFPELGWIMQQTQWIWWKHASLFVRDLEAEQAAQKAARSVK